MDAQDKFDAFKAVDKFYAFDAFKTFEAFEAIKSVKDGELPLEAAQPIKELPTGATRNKRR